LKIPTPSNYRNCPDRPNLRLLLCPLLFVLWTIALWPGPSQTALGQTATSRRFTEGLIFREVAPGIEHGQVSSGQASTDESTGPWFINALRIDLQRARLKIVRALDEGVGLETVSSMSSRHSAIAAINGGYFRTTGTYRGESLGFVFLEGKLISEPHNNRVEFGLINKGASTEVIFGHLKFSGEISVGPAKHSVQGVNRPLSPNELIIFTPEFHRTSLTNPDGIEVVVRRNRVVTVADGKGSSQIPSDGYVISANGTAREWVKQHFRKGAKAKFYWRMTPIQPGDGTPWGDAFSILGGGPQILKDGKIAITDVEEKMPAGFATDRHPRTAIARLKSGKLLMVTVDGRQPGVSVGMSLYTLADLLLEFGAVQGINLDGGGSTTMVVHQKVVNKPSDQTGERSVSDAILVFSKAN
jgi:exopolysaccharide biosynthesis protein